MDLVIGDEFEMRREPDGASEWYAGAIDSARRPVDVYLAHRGAGLVAGLREDGPEAERRMAAAPAVPGIPEADKAFVRSLLKLAEEARAAGEERAETAGEK